MRSNTVILRLGIAIVMKENLKTLLAIALFLWAVRGVAAKPTLIISEFMAANDAVLRDANGDYSDWVELHNYGPESVSLEGLFLTDSRKKLSKSPLPARSIDAGDYLVLWARAGEGRVGEDEGRLSFNLQVKGDYLALVDRDGETVLHDFGKEYPKQKTNVSFGVAAPWSDGVSPVGYHGFLIQPTPGEPNSGRLLGTVASVKLSHSRAFVDEPFRLSLKTKTKGAEIRYTTNGAEPTLEEGQSYQEPIPIAATTVIRVSAFRDGYLPAKVKTHSYIFASDVARQSADNLPEVGFPYAWGENRVDYGMDPRIIEDPRFRDQFVEGLKSIPSISVVTEMDHLFGAESGIYSNPGQQGREWERPCSIEMIEADSDEGFQVEAGIRIRGGFSRDLSNPKHAFRFFFRDVYGPSKLTYPLFGKKGAKRFDNIDLRTFQNYSWSNSGDPRGIFIRDQFNRDLHLAMGQPGARGEFYHLFLNGMYWGIYNTCERPEASYGETYLGGDKTEYDVIKVDSGRTVRRATYTLIPTDGDMEAWRGIFDIVSKGLEHNEHYFALLGRNPDGTPSDELQTYIDLDNLITYMMVIFYGGNLDAPISSFGGNQTPNNWHGIRRRGSNEGFKFFVWDAEHTFLDVREDRTGPFNTGRSFERTSPQWIWEKAVANPEFRMAVADHIYTLYFNDGLLTPRVMRKAFLKRASELETAVVCESARWGDASGRRRGRSEGPLNQTDWKAEVQRILEEYIPRRSGIVLGQLYAQGLWPDVAPPRFKRPGGRIKRGQALEVSVPDNLGKVYLTLDGTDPRSVGGGISLRALEYAEPIPLRTTTQVKARTYIDGDWSALATVEYKVK
mgnify:CR=1 FL=1